MATFFTSDTHFSDHRVISLYKRPFANAAAMDEALITMWNATVGADDHIWHLGDFARGNAGAAILPRLNGIKHLIRGNNDPAETLALPGWASVVAYDEIIVDGTNLVICHYPFRTWNGIGRGAWNLHGHSHGRLKPLPRQADVGADVWQCRPVTFAELKSRKPS
ncbi:MAG: metallophosphoesterase [Rhodospirillaceae bacterium]|nr:metallophosphoesterase [Rhodospirillales bacterium]